MSVDPKIHGEEYRKRAAELFNGTWELLDKADRDETDDLNMINQAHASRYLWGLVGNEPQLATGEWQVSRVYAALGMGQSALYHGKASLRFCEQGQLPAFDFAFAHEAVARASALLGDEEETRRHAVMANDFANKVEDAGNRDYVLSELKTIMKD